MYLFFFDRGTIKKSEKITENDLIMVEYGDLDIVEIKGPVATQYKNGEWHNLEEVY